VLCTEETLPGVVLSPEKNFQWQFSCAEKKNSTLSITPTPPTKRLYDKASGMPIERWQNRCEAAWPFPLSLSPLHATHTPGAATGLAIPVHCKLYLLQREHKF